MDDPTSHGAHFFDPLAYGLVDYNEMRANHHEMLDNLSGGHNFTNGVQDSEMTNFHNSTNNNGY